MTSGSEGFEKSFALEINGIKTNIVFHRFVNKLFLIINQYEKINNIFVTRNEQSFTGVIQNRSVDIQHKFGTDTDDIQSALMYLVPRVPILRDSELDLVVNIGLKEINRSVLVTLEKVLSDML